MPQTERLKEIIHEQQAYIDQLEHAVIKVKSESKTYKWMWQSRNLDKAVKESITGQFDSFVSTLDDALIKPVK